MSVDCSENALDQEVEKLMRPLKHLKEKFTGTDQFTGEQLKEFGEEERLKNVRQLQQSKAELEDLHASLRGLKEQAENNKQAFDSRREKQQKNRDLLDDLNKVTDEILREKETLVANIEQMKADTQEELQLIKGESSVTEQRKHELEKSASWFKERLGLQFKKISGDRLQVVFTNIDHKDPSRPFYFCVRINSDGTYTVSDCEPPLPELDDLVARLNRTNNFRSFVLCIRKEFKSMV